MRTFILAIIAATILNVLVGCLLAMIWPPLGVMWAMLVVLHYVRIARSVNSARKLVRLS